MKYISFMNDAILQAQKAFDEGEVPVGCVIVRNGEIIAKAHNMCEKNKNATHHAEILAINDAMDKTGEKYLTDCSLYVTLEPCPMCMGAIINSRIKRVVYGAKDAKAGACGSLVNLTSYPFNHKPLIDHEVMADECAAIISDFFYKKR